MIGITPDTYKNFQSSLLAARSYSIEEMNDWTVVHKNGSYIPCRNDDMKDALKEGYNQCTSIRFERGEFKDG